MENKRKHLEFIQNVITRMSSNLFYLRGWTITLIAGIFALFVKDSDTRYIFIVYFPILICWILDGYFLSQERKFRALYNYVRKLPENKIDFSLDTTRFDKDENNSWLFSMFSKTLLLFYIPFLIIILILTCLLI